jgi:UDP-N-acetylglucosamine:LPS N-acetylglucosamine transferase
MVMVRGLPEQDPKSSFPYNKSVPNAQIFGHLPTEKLSGLIANAEIVLCRSGYSSIMDLVPIRKNCFMVPTPGQIEQEYLADFLSADGRIRTCRQDKFQLSDVLGLQA